MRISRLSRLGKLRFLGCFLIAAAALGTHIWTACSFVTEQPDDSKLYIQLAKNLLAHGVFSGETQAPFTPTLIRLPGYPVFLSVIYGVFGDGNERAIRIAQAVIYTLTCLMAALIASNWVEKKERKSQAGWLAFVLAAFCPFTAIYSATKLTETLTMFFLAAMTLAATYAFKSRKRKRAGAWWAIAGLLGDLGVMLRPDAGLFAFGIGLTIVISVFWGQGKFAPRVYDRIWKGVVFSVAFMLPLVPWTIRNEQVFGVFQPLAPAHAEMPGEFVSHGYFLWLRTWIDDSKYIGPMIWNLEEKPIRIEDVPAYAFASCDEKIQISTLLDQYNSSDPDHPPASTQKAQLVDNDDSGDQDAADDGKDNDDAKDNNDDQNSDDANSSDNAEWNLKIAPDVDAGFAQIANERIAREPWRFHVWLPAKRSASMWFDTHSDFYPFGGELLPLTDLDNERYQQVWLPLFAGLTWVYTLLAFGGLLFLWLERSSRSRLWLLMVLLVGVPRIVFFGTLENPEPRYLVELFVLAAILGGIALARVRRTQNTSSIGLELHYGD